MPITIKYLPQEPILLATIKGYLNIKSTKDACSRVVKKCQGTLSHTYCVIDVCEATTSFADLIWIIKQAAAYGDSSQCTMKNRVVFVGESHWIQLFSDAMQHTQFGGIEIPIFETIDTALVYIRSELAKNQASA